MFARKMTRYALGLSLLATCFSVAVALADEPAPPPAPRPADQAPPPAAVPDTIEFHAVASPDGKAPPAIEVHSGTVHRIAPFNIALPAPEQGKYWLGVMSTPAPEVLRAQLGLAKESGLVVEDVVPEGPAAKAGIKRNDVLTTADGKPLTDIAALGKVVNDKGTKEIEVGVLRAGKPLSLKITPAERPVGNAFFVASAQAPPAGAPLKTITEWTEQLRKQAAEGPRMEPGRPLRMMILHPGRLIQGAAPDKPFPADLSVTIVREGNNPAKITVKEGDKSWEIGANELRKLPETVRPHIVGYLQRLGMADVLMKAPPPAPAGAQADGAIEIQLEGSVEEPPATAGTRIVTPVTGPAGAGQGVIVVHQADGTVTATAGSAAGSSSASSSSSSSGNRDGDLKALREQLRAMQERLDRMDREGKK